ncbi:ABC transporter substrate-binding protein [Chloroflexota bacterium]
MAVMKKAAWLVVSIMMVLSLIMASCGTTTVDEEEEEEVVTEEEEEEQEQEEVVTEGKDMVRDSLGRLVEKPKYGGTFRRYYTTSPSDFDEAIFAAAFLWQNVPVMEGLLTGDWSKGPTGSGESSFRAYVWPNPDVMKGLLAESFEIVDANTIEFKIRKGVHFHNKAPVNGREVTAEDVVYSIMRVAESPVSYYNRSHPIGRTLESITAPDKYTVVAKSMPGMLYHLYYAYFTLGTVIVPHEVIDTYGDMQDWRNIVGTGPFMMTDFVADSILKYERNPDYYGKDPLHPDNTLPYVDSLETLIIPDVSTVKAAFRTGKIDILDEQELEVKEILAKEHSEILWDKYLPGGAGVSMRNTIPPYDDIRVRRALGMAVDRQAIADLYYKGDAIVHYMTCSPVPELLKYYTPLDELSESAKELYSYDPEKAKDLLEEAGYPDGFKTNIITSSANVDLISIIIEYWKAINVEVEIKVKEAAEMRNMTRSDEYDAMIWTGRSAHRPEAFSMVKSGQSANHSYVDDPKTEQAFEDGAATVLTDPAANIQLVKEMDVWITEQAFWFNPPLPYSYIGWWPWVKSYTGEIVVGGRARAYDIGKYLWVDTDLKKSMGY